MDSAEIISLIRKNYPDFNVLSASRDFSDELRLKVEPAFFGKACLALHKIFLSPVVSLFAEDKRADRGNFVIQAVFLNLKQAQWVLVSTDIGQENPSFDSLAKNIQSASLFERQIKEMFGIQPLGNPDTRRLNLHDEVWPAGAYPLRKDFQPSLEKADGEFKFNKVEGSGIFEVPVGPVHAGIIGPGHFRFSCAGEPIVNLEIRLGFTHRGVEKLMEQKSCVQALELAQRISGDSVIAYACAFAQAAQKISGIELSPDAVYLRGVLLELERLYNHVSDIGGMALDVGFSFPSAYASLIKEALLQINFKLTGARYLKNAIVLGGVRLRVDAAKKELLRRALEEIKKDFFQLEKMLNSSVSFMDRVDTTGVLIKKTAQDLGVTGLTARASGIAMDLRKNFFPEYAKAKFKLSTAEGGDVLARLNVRTAEFYESIRLVLEFMDRVEGKEPVIAPLTPKSGSALGYSEGARGPVLCWLATDAQGLIQRCAFTDPSMHNWPALGYAVLGNIIPDFPLCNKSFNLSYPGNDL